MATNHEWHYSKDGTQYGPVSSSDLEALAASGELSPSDLIWKEGMADWKSAGKFKGLFPETDSSSDEDRKPSSSTSHIDAPSGQPEPKRSLLASAKSAAQFATNKAERTKLTSLTLPSLFQALGRHCYSSQEFRDEFTEPFQILDKIQTSQSEIASRAQPATKTLGEKAKVMGGQAMQAVESKKLSLRQSSLFGSLGKAVYEKHEEKSGPQDLVKPIHDTLARISILDQELKTLSTTGSGLRDGAKRTAMGFLFHPASVFLSMLMCFPIGLILVWKHPTWTTFRKLRWTGGFCAVALSLVYLGIHIRHEATASLASANQLWSAGDKDMAVPKYKRAISLALSVIPEGERPVVFKRVIEHEAERGNQASAKELIGTALNKQIPLNLDGPQAKEIMVAVQAERQRVRDEAADKERQAALAAQTAKAEQAKAKPTQDEAKKSVSPPPSEKANSTTPVSGQMSYLGKKVSDFLSSKEMKALRHPIRVADRSEARTNRKSNGVELVRWSFIGPDEGSFFEDGKLSKDIQFDGKTDTVLCVTAYSVGEMKMSQRVYFYDDGTIRSLEDFDSREQSKYKVSVRVDHTKESETFRTNGVTDKTIWYHENGQKGAVYRDDPRASSSGNQFWDKDGKTIDQNAFCKMLFGSDWRGNFSREGDRNQKRNIQEINETYEKIRSKGN